MRGLEHKLQQIRSFVERERQAIPKVPAFAQICARGPALTRKSLLLMVDN